ncbi:MAG TPA: glycosyltransferase [Pirellulaceae bacterium]|nr:glycosyltransferase [Pirellulaceae bacterium]
MNSHPNGSPLLVFADDWGRHPSSCQHLIRELLPSQPTLWVNTIGTRKPRFDLATLRRGLEKLSAWSSRKNVREQEPLPANLRVISPRMWPYFSHAHDRWLNRKLLTQAITPALTNSPVTALTTLPITADLVGRLPVAQWVYYCVDDFSQWPGLDGKTLATLERELVAKVDTIVAASAVLQARMQAFGREAKLLTHGVDLEHWTKPSRESEPLWPELPRPWIVFWGLIDRRLDTEWLAQLDRQLTQGTILLVGPTQDFDPQLLKLPRVALRPALPFAQLPRFAQQASALIMPYADLPVTRAMQPLKLLEYLATGQPVIVRDLPAVREWSTALDACTHADAFTAAVLKRITTGTPDEQQQARARLHQESWRAKAEQLQAWL